MDCSRRQLCYLQQLGLQQVEHLPSAHFAQELQDVLQQLLQAALLSAAMALERPKPAITASNAPALIRVVSDFIFLVWFRAGVFPLHKVIRHPGQNPPKNFGANSKASLTPLGTHWGNKGDSSCAKPPAASI